MPAKKNITPAISKKIEPVKSAEVNKNTDVDLYSESDNNYTESEESNVEESNVKESNVKKSKENFVKTDFLEKIIKYVKIDNLIRKETVEYKERVNTLKEDKQELEGYILRYLEDAKEEVINIEGSGKLTKYESVRKGGINKDIIQQSICDQLKKEKLIQDEKKIKDLAELTYNIMESKREKKVKTVLKRTFKREKKQKEDVKEANKKQSEKYAKISEVVNEKPSKVKKGKKT